MHPRLSPGNGHGSAARGVRTAPPGPPQYARAPRSHAVGRSSGSGLPAAPAFPPRSIGTVACTGQRISTRYGGASAAAFHRTSLFTPASHPAKAPTAPAPYHPTPPRQPTSPNTNGRPPTHSPSRGRGLGGGTPRAHTRATPNPSPLGGEDSLTRQREAGEGASPLNSARVKSGRRQISPSHWEGLGGGTPRVQEHALASRRHGRGPERL